MRISTVVCDGCGRSIDPKEVFDVTVTAYGVHDHSELCGECASKLREIAPGVPYGVSQKMRENQLVGGAK